MHTFMSRYYTERCRVAQACLKDETGIHSMHKPSQKDRFSPIPPSFHSHISIQCRYFPIFCHPSLPWCSHDRSTQAWESAGPNPSNSHVSGYLSWGCAAAAAQWQNVKSNMLQSFVLLLPKQRGSGLWWKSNWRWCLISSAGEQVPIHCVLLLSLTGGMLNIHGSTLRMEETIKGFQIYNAAFIQFERFPSQKSFT